MSDKERIKDLERDLSLWISLARQVVERERQLRKTILGMAGLTALAMVVEIFVH